MFCPGSTVVHAWTVRARNLHGEVTKGPNVGVALGPLIHSRATFVFAIRTSRDNDGEHMLLGLADANAAFTDRSGGRAWGFAPYWGRLRATEVSAAYRVRTPARYRYLLRGRRTCTGKARRAARRCPSRCEAVPWEPR